MQRLRQQPTEEEDLRINIKAILMPSLDWVEDVVIVGSLAHGTALQGTADLDMQVNCSPLIPLNSLIPQILARESRPRLEEDVVSHLDERYPCTIKDKRGNRRLIVLDSRASPGSVDVTVVPKVTPLELHPCHRVVFYGVMMRSILETEKASTNVDEVNNITLELKLAGQMADLKAPGFALEVLSCLGAIGRGQSESIWNTMKRILEDSNYLCFQRARNLDSDFCRHQDSPRLHQDMSKKLFCTAAGLLPRPTPS